MKVLDLFHVNNKKNQVNISYHSQNLFKLATPQAHYLNYKYSTRQFWKKTSRFQENQPRLKTTLTSLHCYHNGNSDLNEKHCTRNFGLSLARVRISMFCIMF